MPLDVGFNPRAFAHSYVGRKVKRFLKKLFDGIGGDNLVYAIQNNRDLISYIPPEKLYKYRMNLPISRRDIGEFSDKEIYSWLPDEYKGIIESQPKGKQWALSQIKSLKKRLSLSS